VKVVGILLVLLGLLFAVSVFIPCSQWALLCEPDDLTPYTNAMKAGGPEH
jgi:hypothetical protein